MSLFYGYIPDYEFYRDVLTDAELASLPRINRNQIILIKFLGSGAFGEVFEGLARNLPGSENEESTPVAIKVCLAQLILACLFFLISLEYF